MTEAPIEDDPPHSAPPLWMLPLILLLAIARFAERLARLRQMRRTRPLPANWKDSYPGLRTCEWHLRQFLAKGAHQVLETGALNLNAIPMFVEVDDDDDFLCPMPASALAMALRLDATACFHADPERYIRRHAGRITRDAERLATDKHADLRPPHAPRLNATSVRRVFAHAWTLGIPAPP